MISLITIFKLPTKDFTDHPINQYILIQVMANTNNWSYIDIFKFYQISIFHILHAIVIEMYVFPQL